MSYNTATEDYRIRGINDQHDEACEFCKKINGVMHLNYIVRRSSLNEDMHEKIDEFLENDKVSIPFDVKIPENKKDYFTLTVITNKFHELYLEKTKSKNLLVCTETNFYWIDMDNLKYWVRTSTPSRIQSIHKNDDSWFIRIPYKEICKWPGTLILNK